MGDRVGHCVGMIWQHTDFGKYRGIGRQGVWQLLYLDNPRGWVITGPKRTYVAGQFETLSAAKRKASFMDQTGKTGAAEVRRSHRTRNRRSRRNPAGLIGWMTAHPWMTFFLGLGLIGVPVAIINASKTAPQLSQ